MKQLKIRNEKKTDGVLLFHLTGLDINSHKEAGFSNPHDMSSPDIYRRNSKMLLLIKLIYFSN